MTAPRVLTPFTAQPLAVRLSVALLIALTAALVVRLWPQWLHNPDLSHGLFMPVIFLLLLRESASGPFRFLPANRLSSLASMGLLLLGLLTLAAGGLYAAALGWSHDLVGFTLTAALVLLLIAGLTVFSFSTVRFLPFNWSALVAIGLWLLCAPLPPGTYSRLTLSLQLLVSENVLRTLHLLGIGAVRHGNILELATTSVGIEEACSGVRSLISCVFAGLFFSASLVRRPWSRVLLIGLSAPLALAMNFLRSLILTLLANSGVHIAGFWHDLTGFAVLAVTAALLAGLALLLERRRTDLPVCGLEATGREARSPFATRITTFTLTFALTLAGALVLFFVANTRPALRGDAPVPDLAAILPTSADGWVVEPGMDLYQFASTLQTDHMAQRTYHRQTASGPEQVTFYLAYWQAGQASVSLVSSHTPDACWPGAGWEAVPVSSPRVHLNVAGHPLPEAENRAFHSGDFPQNVWFWHLYDGRPITQQDPRSPLELLRQAWHYGFRHDGDQLFVRVSSNRPWPELAQEPLLSRFFARLQPLGL